MKLVKIFGVLSMDGFDFFVGTSYLDIAQQVTMLDADDSVDKILLFFDSPGGSTGGLDIALNAIRSCKKETIALIAGMACSAAYWLAVACKRIVALGNLIEVGSIGAWNETYDDAEAAKNSGYERWRVVSKDSPDKIPVNMVHFENLMQEGVDRIYNLFFADVCLGRNQSAEQVKKYASGRIYMAQQALELGMIDEINNNNIFLNVEDMDMDEQAIVDQLLSDADMAIRVIVAVCTANADVASAVLASLEGEEDAAEDAGQATETVAIAQPAPLLPPVQPVQQGALAKSMRADAGYRGQNQAMPAPTSNSFFDLAKQKIDAKYIKGGR